MVHVSHDLALLGSLADEVSVMYGGEIVEHGPTTTVLEAPRHPYTRALLAAAPTVSERRNVVGIDGRPPAEVIMDACSFAARCRHVAAACLERHIDVTEVSQGHLVRCIRLDVSSSGPTASLRPVSIPKTERALLEVDDLWCAYTKASDAAVAGVSLSDRPRRDAWHRRRVRQREIHASPLDRRPSPSSPRHDPLRWTRPRTGSSAAQHKAPGRNPDRLPKPGLFAKPTPYGR